jgi:two-component system chemotaxis sensor kinase CheA
VEAALAEQKQVREMQQKRQSSEATNSIRVPSEKLDKLVNLVGELVTVQARLTQTAGLANNPQLTLIAEEVERLTQELRDGTLNIRMMPIGATFSKFKRLVRDLSVDLGKEVELITEGASTELDKTVIERLNDPLVHIIRNSIDHGIESPDAREKSGKARQGTVRLTAEHAGECVLITIEDDGAGLDREAIRSKAVEKRLIAENAELSDKELFALIFAAGFSTAKKITGVSGRGVGMDVVKQSIEALRGAIEISSRKGEGVLSHIDVQGEVDKKYPGTVETMFQSLAGTDDCNKTFDVTIEKILNYAKAKKGKRYGLYFETGQGSEFTNGGRRDRTGETGSYQAMRMNVSSATCARHTHHFC